MREFLESLGVIVPDGAVSYSTEGSNKIIFLIGKTGEFLDDVLTEDQADKMKEFNCFGSFGWDL